MIMSMREYLHNTLVPKLFICLRENYNFDTLNKDVIAGVSVAIISIPLAMALAISCGSIPKIGLITAVIAGSIGSCFGGSRFQISGPTAAFVAIICSIINKHGYDALIIITFISGIILIVSGLLRVGFLIKYIPHSIITGFTSGLAVVIFSTQIKDLLGLNIEHIPIKFWNKWWVYFQHLHSFSINAVLISTITILLILIIRKKFPKMPIFFIVVVLATSVVSIFNIKIPTIGTKFGVISNYLPSPKLPLYSLDKLLILLPDILTVTLLAGIESLLSAVIADNITSTKHNSNVELIAQGLANSCSACFGGLPSTGAIARTVANIKAGGKTPIAGIISALLIFIFIKFFSSITSLIPLSCLAAILIIIAWDMSDLKKMRYVLLHYHNIDSLVIMITFLLTILTDLVIAIQVGLMLDWGLKKSWSKLLPAPNK